MTMPRHAPITKATIEALTWRERWRKRSLGARGILKHAAIQSPLLPLEKGAEQEIHAAVGAAQLSRVDPDGFGHWEIAILLGVI